uniref:Hypothetical membrane protein n=1 Tax=uncultured virus TaxID=340016 RepID=D5L2G1_9VIRU|nr:hypothetical membrane protein [uncultured virus]
MQCWAPFSRPKIALNTDKTFVSLNYLVMMDGKNLSNLIWIPVFIVLMFYLIGILLWFFELLFVSWRIIWFWPLFILGVWFIVTGIREAFN